MVGSCVSGDTAARPSAGELLREGRSSKSNAPRDGAAAAALAAP